MLSTSLAINFKTHEQADLWVSDQRSLPGIRIKIVLSGEWQQEVTQIVFKWNCCPYHIYPEDSGSRYLPKIGI